MEKDFELFQVVIPKDTIDKWIPLTAHCAEPKNCAATALTLSAIIPRDYAQIEGDLSEHIGMQLPRITGIIKAFLTRFEIIDEPIPKSIFRLTEYLTQNLQNGNITIIGLYNQFTGLIGHIIIICKFEDSLILFDGQTRASYKGDHAIMQYIIANGFTHFTYWLMKNTRKRLPTFENIVEAVGAVAAVGAEVEEAEEAGPKKRKTGVGKQRKTKKRRAYRKQRKTNRMIYLPFQYVKR